MISKREKFRLSETRGERGRTPGQKERALAVNGGRSCEYHEKKKKKKRENVIFNAGQCDRFEGFYERAKDNKFFTLAGRRRRRVERFQRKTFRRFGECARIERYSRFARNERLGRTKLYVKMLLLFS